MAYVVVKYLSENQIFQDELNFSQKENNLLKHKQYVTYQKSVTTKNNKNLRQPADTVEINLEIKEEIEKARWGGGALVSTNSPKMSIDQCLDVSLDNVTPRAAFGR